MNVREIIKTTQMFVSVVAVLLSTAVARADISSDLQVRYRFDDGTGTSVPDSSGNGLTGTLHSATFTDNGRFGRGVDLTADDNHIECPEIDDTNNAAELTVAFWIKPSELGNYDIICGKYQDNQNLFTVQLGEPGLQGTNDLIVFIYNGAGGTYFYTSGNWLSVGTWVHVAVVFDGDLSLDNRCKIYINGQSVTATRVGSTPATLYDSTGEDPWFIGWHEDEPDTYDWTFAKR